MDRIRRRGGFVVCLAMVLIGGLALAGPAGATNPPSISALSVARGPAAGGNEVVITGSAFTGATNVRFGPTAQATINFVSDTEIRATAPAGTAGVLVNVRVDGPGGTSATSNNTLYYYVDPPEITASSPKAGPTGATTTVTLTGVGFNGATEIRFGLTSGYVSVVAPNYTVDSDTQITVTAPAHAEDSGEIQVVEGGAISTKTTAGVYGWTDAVPTYTGVSGGVGLVFVGDSITNQASTALHTEFDGTYAVSVKGRSGYRVAEMQPYATDYADGPTGGGIPQRAVINLGTNDTLQSNAGSSPTIDIAASAGQLETLIDTFQPATSCIVAVTVNTMAGLGDPDTATVINDRVADLAAASGGRIQIADWNAAIVAHQAEPHDSNWHAWTSDTIHPDATYGRPALISLIHDALDNCAPNTPVITSLTPTAGPHAGGTTVTITGTGFTGATNIRFGPSTPAASITALSDTQAVVVTPAYGAGVLVNVRVDNPTATSATHSNTVYYFQP